MSCFFYFGGWYVPLFSCIAPYASKFSSDVLEKDYGKYQTNGQYVPGKESYDQERAYTYQDWVQQEEL